MKVCLSYKIYVAIPNTYIIMVKFDYNYQFSHLRYYIIFPRSIKQIVCAFVTHSKIYVSLSC